MTSILAVPLKPEVGHSTAELLAARRFANILVWGVGLYPLVWLTGLGGIFMLLLSVPSAVFLVMTRISRPGLIALLVGASIGVSIPVGIAAFGLDPLRIFGAAANIGVWVVLAATLSAASYLDIRRRLMTALCIAVAAQGLLIAASAIVYPSKLPVPLLDSIAARLPSGIAAFADNSLYVSSWLGGSAFRTSGIWANPTWSAATASLVILGIVAGKAFRPRKALALAALVGAAITVYFGLSRTSYALLGVGAAVALLMVLRSRSRFLFVAALSVLIPLVIAFLLVGQGALASIFEEVDGARSGSSKSRGEVYAQTWNYFLKNPFPLLGYGIKPQEEGLVASVGTLSTWIGLLFRAGVVGFVLFALLLLILLRQSLRTNSVFGVTVIVFVAIWAWIADMDAGHFVPLFLAFCVVPGPNYLSPPGQKVFRADLAVPAIRT